MAATTYRIDIDGNCGFCRHSAGWLKALDWRDVVRIVPVEEPDMKEMRVTRTSDGVTRGGFDGFRLVARGVPLLLPVWPLLYVPGVPSVGRVVYRWVARNRRHMPGGCDAAACSIDERP